MAISVCSGVLGLDSVETFVLHVSRLFLNKY